jgi:hypothetical protein
MTGKPLKIKDIPLPRGWNPKYEIHITLVEPYHTSERFLKSIDFLAEGMGVMWNGAVTTVAHGLTGTRYVIGYARKDMRDSAYSQLVGIMKKENMGDYLKAGRVDIPTIRARKVKPRVNYSLTRRKSPRKPSTKKK